MESPVLPLSQRVGLQSTLPAQAGRRGLRFQWRSTGSEDLRCRYQAACKYQLRRNLLQSRLRSDFILNGSAARVQCKELINSIRVTERESSSALFRTLLGPATAAPLNPQASPLNRNSRRLAALVCQSLAEYENIQGCTSILIHTEETANLWRHGRSP